MPEGFCEQCGQALAPNARFCDVCGWAVDDQATVPLPQGSLPSYDTQDHQPQGEPTPLEEFEREFERENAYDPYDPYDAGSYADGSYGSRSAYAGGSSDAADVGSEQNGRGSRKSRAGGKNRKSGGTSKKNAARATTPRKTPHRHTATVVTAAALACVVVVFGGMGIARMMSDSRSRTVSSASANADSATSGGTHAGGGNTAGKSDQSTATDATESRKTDARRQSSQQSSDGRYANARFGYSITVPSDFVWQRESDNGDGRTFTNSRLGMTITVSGSNNALNETPDSAFAQATAGHPVSYQQIIDSEFTASWEENGTITYIRELVSTGAIRTIRFDYPSAQRTECDRIVEQVVPTLTLTGSTAESGQ